MIALLVAITACSREPMSDSALPAAPEIPAALDEETAGPTAATPIPTPDTIPQNDGMSAAAGIPQPLSQPLVENLSIDFEYGTLFEFGNDPVSAEREVAIEPIGTPVEAALDSLTASLTRAGFEPLPQQPQANPLHRWFRRATEPSNQEIELLASSYAEPELAAHPGGTGSVAMRLRTSKGNH